MCGWAWLRVEFVFVKNTAALTYKTSDHIIEDTSIRNHYLSIATQVTQPSESDGIKQKVMTVIMVPEWESDWRWRSQYIRAHLYSSAVAQATCLIDCTSNSWPITLTVRLIANESAVWWKGSAVSPCVSRIARGKFLGGRAVATNLQPWNILKLNFIQLSNTSLVDFLKVYALPGYGFGGHEVEKFEKWEMTSIS